MWIITLKYIFIRLIIYYEIAVLYDFLHYLDILV